MEPAPARRSISVLCSPAVADGGVSGDAPSSTDAAPDAAVGVGGAAGIAGAPGTGGMPAVDAATGAGGATGTGGASPVDAVARRAAGGRYGGRAGGAASAGTGGAASAGTGGAAGAGTGGAAGRGHGRRGRRGHRRRGRHRRQRGHGRRGSAGSGAGAGGGPGGRGGTGGAGPEPSACNRSRSAFRRASRTFAPPPRIVASTAIQRRMVATVSPTPPTGSCCETLYACLVGAPAHPGTSVPGSCTNGGDTLACWCGSNPTTCASSNAPPTQADGPCRGAGVCRRQEPGRRHDLRDLFQPQFPARPRGEPGDLPQQLLFDRVRCEMIDGATGAASHGARRRLEPLGVVSLMVLRFGLAGCERQPHYPTEIGQPRRIPARPGSPSPPMTARRWCSLSRPPPPALAKPSCCRHLPPMPTPMPTSV